jgi:hypothetical protein
MIFTLEVCSKIFNARITLILKIPEAVDIKDF